MQPPSAIATQPPPEAVHAAPGSLLHAVSRWRVRVGHIGMAIGVAYLVILRVPPRDLLDGSTLSLLGLGLVLAGTLVRLAAMGTLKKNEELATTEVYSLCRHPLYLGSLLMASGFSILFWSVVAASIVGAYFAVFYTVAILREDRFLEQKFGAAFDEFRRTTPALLPMGRYRRGHFSWRQAIRWRGLNLFATQSLLLAVVQTMHVKFGSG